MNQVDPDFPLNEETIGKKNYVWKSFSGYPLFTDEFGSYPKQGKLGNCYWIAPLVAVYAVKPTQIQSLFTDYSTEFISLRLCIDGEWQNISVDLHFPYNTKKDRVAYCKLVDGAIWAMALEKAWAKLYGSYGQIGGGFNRTTLKTLTGAPTNKFRIREEKFPEIFYEIGKLRFPVGANSKKQQSDKTYAKNHAYSVLKIDENFIVVRNPWGKKNQDQHTLTLEEFRDRFASIECCYHYENYRYESLRATSDVDQPVYFEIDILVPGNYFFTINQKNKRWFRKQKSFTYKISPCQISLLVGGVVLNEQKHLSNKELWINWNFSKPCKVVVACSIQWQSQYVNEFIFNTYGAGFTQKQVEGLDATNPQMIQDLGYVQFHQRDSEKEQEDEEKLLTVDQVQETKQDIVPTEIKPDQQKDRKPCGMCAIY